MRRRSRYLKGLVMFAVIQHILPSRVKRLNVPEKYHVTMRPNYASSEHEHEVFHTQEDANDRAAFLQCSAYDGVCHYALPVPMYPENGPKLPADYNAATRRVTDYLDLENERFLAALEDCKACHGLPWSPPVVLEAKAIIVHPVALPINYVTNRFEHFRVSEDNDGLYIVVNVVGKGETH